MRSGEAVDDAALFLGKFENIQSLGETILQAISKYHFF